MATGPAEPSATDQPVWEEDAPHSADAPVALRDAEPAFAVDPDEHTPPRRFEPWRLRHIMYLVAVVAVLLWLGILFASAVVIGVLLVFAGLVLLFSAVMGAGVILARRSSTRQDALLGVLAIAAERGMPLAPAVMAFADQYRGLSHRRIMNLAARLNWGTMLPEALEQAFKIVARDAVLLAWVGQAAGRLPRALRMAATSRTTQLPIWTAIAARLSYILGVMMVLQIIGSFVLYFIIPKFEAIFSDFNVSLPQVTIWVIEASHFLIRYGIFTFILLAGEVGLLFFLPMSFLAWGNFGVPLFDRLLGRRHTALILRSLALVVEGGKPISLGLTTLANHYPLGRIRRRLHAVATDVHLGAGWVESLKRRGLIRAAEAEVLVSANEVGNLAWALLELAESAERRLATRFQVATQTLFPLAVILLGVVVFIMAVAYFLPLVMLITELTKQ